MHRTKVDEGQPGAAQCLKSSPASDRLLDGKEPLSRRPILVIEDDPVSCQLIGEILVTEGYNIELSCSPLEALNRISESDYCLVVSDVRMPHLPGPKLASKIRRTHANLPILFVTAFPDSATEMEARALKVPILSKPFTPSILVEHVRKLLGDGSTAA